MSDPASSTSRNRGDEESLDQIIEAFETAWNSNSDVELSQFFPPPSHSAHDDVLTELLCVDLERRFKLGRHKTVSDYKREFPELLDHKPILERLAFEEYRLLSGQGAPVTAVDYARRFGISTEYWPAPAEKNAEHNEVARDALTNGVADEMGRIAGVTQTLPDVGDHFLDFEIVERLGECKFGSVYLARQANLAGRNVVIKATTNLWAESDRLARLQHTNIVPIYSVHQHDGLQAACMPFLGRQTLANLLDKGGGRLQTSSDFIHAWFDGAVGDRDVSYLSPPEKHVRFLSQLSFEKLCAWIVAQIASGLCHAHDRKILHRDLKPANILLTDDGQPMILDFNLSAEVVAGGRASLLIGGTLPYMAPEQLRAVIGGGEVDQRSDVYSLGVILFQLLTGELPFPPQSGSIIGNLSLLINDRNSVHASVRKHNAQWSVDIDTIVSKCLSSRVEDRYQTAHELRDDLERHLGDLPLLHAPNRSRQQRLVKWVRRHPKTMSSTAVATVCAALLMVLMASLAFRNHELARHRATETLREFERQTRQVLGELSPGMTDAGMIAAGLEQADTVLDTFSANELDWREQSWFRRLSGDQQSKCLQLLQNLHFVVAATKRAQAARLVDEDRRQKFLQQALDHNQRARELRGGTSRAISLQHADIKDALGNAEEAEQIREGAGALQDRDFHSRLQMAMQRMRAFDFAAAEGILTELEAAHTPFSWLLLGNCRMAMNRLQDAEDCFTASVALWPEFYSAYYRRGVCRAELKRWQAAEHDFDRVLRRRPGHPGTLVKRAVVRSRRGDHQAAVDDFSAAIASGRDESLIYLLRSRAWRELGQADQAQADWEVAQRREPESNEGWIQRGIEVRASDLELALDCFERALQMDARSRKTLINKAAILSQLGRDQEACETLTELLRDSPHDATFLLGRALLLARLEQDERALTDLEAAQPYVRSPGHQFQVARVRSQLSRRFPEQGDLAVDSLRDALLGDPKLIDAVRKDPDMKPIAQRFDVRRILSAAATLRGEPVPALRSVSPFRERFPN